MAFSLQIDGLKFDEIFPFSFIINESMEFVKAGISLRKLFSNIESSRFDELMKIKRPTHAQSSFKDLLSLTNQIIILNAQNDKNLSFRYGMIPLKGGQQLFFVGSPWVTQAESLKEFGLKLKDFALHDAITDLLQVLTVKNIALEEVRKLNEQLEISEEKYRLVVENANDIISYLDKEYNIIYTNKVALEKSGLELKEIVGKCFFDFVHKDFRINARNHYINSHHKESQKYFFEFPFLNKNKKTTWLEQSVQPLYDKSGNVISYFSVSRDITEKKKFEEELILAKQRAEAAQEAEQQFLARMSHEIRTPLNAVVGMSHLLKETRTTIEENEYLEILSSSADLLQNLISDILDLSKITAGQVEVVNAPLDLKKIFETLYKSFRIKCAEKDIKLSYYIDPKVEVDLIGDELLLNQVLINLISNAIKFTSVGEIYIEVDVVEHVKNAQSLQICISDTGIGISKDNLSSIFENFKQAHGEISRQYGGTGLGLAIVYQLVNLLEGSIHVKSELGKGSCFTVQLPMIINDKKEKHYKHYQVEEKIVLDKLDILIAEDNVMNRKYVSRLMENWGVTYDIVFNGQEAVDVAKAKKYNLILMDIEMPLKNGYEATAEIRKTIGPNQLSPIIALTASALTEHKHLAEDIGMDGFISKPFSPKQLKEKLEEYARLVHVNFPNKLQQIEGLDRLHLDEMYGDDKTYALEMFELFVEHVHPEYQMLRSLIKKSDIESARALLHKIIPSFSLVGLTLLGKKLTAFNEMIKSSFDRNKALADLDALNKEFHISYILIQEEICRLSS